ncbi:MAG: peptidylprolyl isomerase [Gemmatimonadaceae bacterium]|nr:peptidylprolyl isomerase [Gemmatimonadaceae bacterium]
MTLSVACSDPCASPEAEEILARAAAEEGAIRTESGLVFRPLRAGEGPKPVMSNRVQVHYIGRFADGEEFDNSYKRSGPSSFQMDQVVPGWTEGLLLMNGGGKAKLTIPAKLAYGKKGKKKSIPPCATLIFEVELLGIYD